MRGERLKAWPTSVLPAPSVPSNNTEIGLFKSIKVYSRVKKLLVDFVLPNWGLSVATISHNVWNERF